MPKDQDPPESPSNDYMRGGKGRKDEVGGSGIYPASVPDAPADAEVRTEGDLVGHKGPKADRSGKPGTTKTDESSGSE